MCSDDDSLPKDSALYRWGCLINEGFRRNGSPIDSVLNYQQQLADAGFVDIQIVKEKWPSNRWPRDSKYKQLGKRYPPGPFRHSIAPHLRGGPR